LHSTLRTGILDLTHYHYLQGISSGRKLEREASRNLEVMTIIEGLQPTYKTIADFRKVIGTAFSLGQRQKEI